MENRTIKCRYCEYRFEVTPMVAKSGKKKTVYIECPRCGNGVESSYKAKKARKYAK